VFKETDPEQRVAQMERFDSEVFRPALERLSAGGSE
jgi:hypothetical protein